MSGFAKASKALSGALAVLGLCLGTASAAPARVVSVNLCTDQLAMMLAAPGQLVSVSTLALDPLSSAMVDEARHYTANMGQAEQVFLLRPDLVLAGTYTARASVDMLRRLGVKVVELPPADALSDVVAHLRIVGVALGREKAAEAMIARYEADLAALRIPTDRPFTAVMYYPNGYTTGAGTLANEVLEAAGFTNIGAEAGLTGGGVLPLERLVMAGPDMIVTSTPYPGASRSEEILLHPALTAIRQGAGAARVTDADWVCGTPHVLRAVAAMAQAHRDLHALRGGQ
jgi:iron complex transport system substrate-binding protein